MKHARILFGLGVLVLSATGALAKPAYVMTVNLRAAPGTTSEIVDKIPGGSLIDATDCADGWCAVTWQEKSGFAIQTAIDLSGRVPRSCGRRRAMPPPGYVEEDGQVYVAPRRRSIMADPTTGPIGVGAGTGDDQVGLSAPISRPSPTLTAR